MGAALANPLVLSVPEWQRLHGDPATITASQCATALDENPYDSAYSLWALKTGRRERGIDSLPARRGRHMEPFVAELYSEETGEALIDYGPTAMWQHPAYPWLYATPDRMRHDMRLVELKSPGINQWENWQDGPPRHYWIQCQIQMQCADVSRCDLAGLLGDSLIIHEIARDDAWFEDVVQELYAFRERCIENDPPPARLSDVALMWQNKRDNGAVLDRPDLLGVCQERDWMLDRAETLAVEIDERTACLKAAMGAAAEMACGPQFRFTWKTDRRGVRSFKGGKRG